MNARILPIAIATLLTLSACGSSDSGGAPSTATSADATADSSASSEVDNSDDGATVMIDQSRFGTPELRVAVGTTVTFVNNDPFAHTVTSRDDSAVQFDSGEFADGETFEVTFDEAGEFAYFCQIHPTMRAVVIVG